VSRLRRSSTQEPGIRRVRKGKGFAYLLDGSPVDAETRARAAALAIPPAWADVWICADARGHLQAVGTDDAGRQQYLYHADWRARRDVAKFERMLRFADALPAARRRVSAHLRDTDPSRRRALACAVRIMDTALVRVGGEQYARTSGSRGLATMPCSAVTIGRDEVRLVFRGKSGVEHDLHLRDAALVRALRPLAARCEGSARDRPLLAYRDGSSWRRVGSADINAYVKEVVGEEFTAKDFRTWHATVVAAEELARWERPASARALSAATKAASLRAAELLGNTPTVARNAYIDPRLFESFARRGIDRTPGQSPEALVRALLG
jgi:DNA topoisomerase IB